MTNPLIIVQLRDAERIYRRSGHRHRATQCRILRGEMFDTTNPMRLEPVALQLIREINHVRH